MRLSPFDSLALLASLALFASCAATPAGRAPEAQALSELEASPYAPRFLVLDTESSLGPYSSEPKTVGLRDLVWMHGHPCDGLVVAAAALELALGELYPGGVIDRTDTGCVSNNSPCFGDVSAYLTGGRVRFGTQRIEPERGTSFVVRRLSTGVAVEVRLRDGVFPAALHELETKLKGGEFSEAELRACQRAQWDFARDLLSRPLEESFTVERLPSEAWIPDAYEHLGARGDIRNRHGAPAPKTSPPPGS